MYGSIGASFEKIRKIEKETPLDQLPRFGVLTNLFLTGDPILIEEIFPDLEDRVLEPEFEQNFIKRFRADVERETAHYRDRIRRATAASLHDHVSEALLKQTNSHLSIDSMSTYFAHIDDEWRDLKDLYVREYRFINPMEAGSNYLESKYLSFAVCRDLFKFYRSEVRSLDLFNGNIEGEIAKIYADFDINIAQSDAQFDKYGLISYGSMQAIINSHDSTTIVDRRINRYLSIEMPRTLLTVIELAINRGWIKEIAFAVTGITEGVIALEALEFGQVFDLDALSLPVLTKLYNEELYDEAIWIRRGVQPNSLTFEEISSDGPAVDGFVTTQVVHLEFSVEDDAFFITHIDHEYILYTEEELERRRTDISVKGIKKKTFKIDRSRIPFEAEFEGRLFLYTVLDTYFYNKKLLREYFERLLQI